MRLTRAYVLDFLVEPDVPSWPLDHIKLKSGWMVPPSTLHVACGLRKSWIFIKWYEYLIIHESNNQSQRSYHGQCFLKSFQLRHPTVNDWDRRPMGVPTVLCSEISKPHVHTIKWSNSQSWMSYLTQYCETTVSLTTVTYFLSILCL